MEKRFLCVWAIDKQATFGGGTTAIVQERLFIPAAMRGKFAAMKNAADRCLFDLW